MEPWENNNHGAIVVTLFSNEIQAYYWDNAIAMRWQNPGNDMHHGILKKKTIKIDINADMHGIFMEQ